MKPLMPAGPVLSYDGSLEGFLCAVFDAYALHCVPRRICVSGAVQLGFFEAEHEVATDMVHAERVRVGLCRQAGVQAWRNVACAFLSDSDGKEDALFAYIVYAMEVGHRVHRDGRLSCVARVEDLVRGVLNERERMYQFLRFEQAENNVYVAYANPRANVVPLVMRHFSERFGAQPFVIYDEGHGIAGMCVDGKQALVATDMMGDFARADGEREVKRLWKLFYDSISNEQRFNPELRRSLVPKRLWRNMTEFQQAVEQRAQEEG